MSAVRNLISKFTKNTVNDTDAVADASPPEKSPDDDGSNSSAFSLPDCAPPKALASRTASFFIDSPVKVQATSGNFHTAYHYNDYSESTGNGATNPPNQLEVSPPASDPASNAPTPDSSPNTGDPSSPTIPADEISTSNHPPPPVSSGDSNSQGSTNNNVVEGNSRTKAQAKVSILSQDIQPQRILSINATLYNAESTTPPGTLAANNTGEAAQEPQEPQEPQITVFDLKKSIRAVLGESHCEVQYLDAVEITGSPECFPFIQETLRQVLKNTPQERSKFSWDKLGDTDAGYREVFLKDQLSPTTQVLILQRHSDFSINLHCGAFKDDDSPNIVWYITGLGNETSPAMVKLVYQLYPSGYCDIHSACTIIGPSGPTEQDTSADKTFIDQRKLDVRYSLIRSASITAQSLLLVPVEIPQLHDEANDQMLPLPHLGGPNLMGIPSCIVAIPQICISILCMAKVSVTEMSKMNIFVSTLFTVVVVAETALICIPDLRYRFLRLRFNPWYALVAAAVGFCMTLAPQIYATFNWKGGGVAIAILSVGLSDALLCGICALLLLELYLRSAIVPYSDYLELGAVLEAESYFPMLFADSNEPRQSKALKRCLKHYRRCEILELLESHDTDKNQKFWREMGILRRIPYALIPGSDSEPDELSLKCLRKDMTRAEAFKFVVIRKRKLCDRLGISIVDTDEEIKKRFSLIRDPDSKLLLI